MEPCSAEGIGHDLASVGDAIGFRETGRFLGLADVLAISVVVGQGVTPVIRWSALWPPPTSVSDSVFAPVASFSAISACWA